MSGLGVALAAVLLVIGVGIVGLNLYGQRQRDRELLARWDGLCAQQNPTPGAHYEPLASGPAVNSIDSTGVTHR
jgi:hypothetical protein